MELELLLWLWERLKMRLKVIIDGGVQRIGVSVPRHVTISDW